MLEVINLSILVVDDEAAFFSEKLFAQEDILSNFSFSILHHSLLLLLALTISVTRKNCRMSIKVAQNDFTRKMIDLTPLQKLPKNVGDLGKLIAAKGFEKLPKVQ